MSSQLKQSPAPVVAGDEASFQTEHLNDSAANDREHPYLVRKDLTLAELKAAAWDQLRLEIVGDTLQRELVDATGASRGYERIWPDGTKKAGHGSTVSGTFSPIGFAPHELLNLSGPLVVCAGLADGYRIHEATGYPVACCVGEPTLRGLADKLFTVAGRAQLLVAADNDDAGVRSAKATGRRWVVPSSAKDWSDVYQQEGIHAVREQLANIQDPFEPESESETRRFNFVAAGAMIQHLKPIDWLLRGYVERDSLAVLFGEPGHGKSFIAIDMACSVSTGTPWHGNDARQGAVFYVAGEGHNGISRRLRAWSDARGIALDDAPLFISETSANLSDYSSAVEVASTVKAMSEDIGQAPALIVVDTLARNFGGDENSATDMGAFIRHLDEMRHEWKATVLVVHHSGKDKTKGARGSTALRGAVDAEYSASKDEYGVITLESGKMKDAEAPAPMSFKLDGVKLPLLDDDMNPIYGAALTQIEGYEPPKREHARIGKNQAAALASLRKLYQEHRKRLERGGQDPDGARVEIEQWRTETSLPRQRFKESKDALVSKGLIREAFPYVELVD
ncbi:AAA family ATPase [Halomonas sp. H5]|uniref:AAA family ATPase n=1 Tax=Halomonas sp. H5 TaxID=3423910 RepID=UPI003D35F1EF